MPLRIPHSCCLQLGQGHESAAANPHPQPRWTLNSEAKGLARSSVSVM